MAKCDLVQDCFFPTDFSNNMPAQLADIKRAYCNQTFEECARYITAKEIDLVNVPNDLHPTDTELAEKIIKLVRAQVPALMPLIKQKNGRIGG